MNALMVLSMLLHAVGITVSAVLVWLVVRLLRRNQDLAVAFQERPPVPVPAALPAAARPRLAERTMRDTGLWLRPVPVPEVVHTEEVELVPVGAKVAGVPECPDREAGRGAIPTLCGSGAPAQTGRVTKVRFADSAIARAWVRMNARIAASAAWPGQQALGGAN